MKVDTKSKFLDLSRRGLLGNTLRTWWTYQDLRASRFKGTVTVRYKVRDSPYFLPVIHTDELRRTLDQQIDRGAEEDMFFFQELPHAAGCKAVCCKGCGRTMNGEVAWLPGGPTMIYGTGSNLSVRDATAGSLVDWSVYGNQWLKFVAPDPSADIVSGSRVGRVIQEIGSSGLWDQLNQIWDIYPDAVIEFTGFSRSVGERGEPWVIWEVRDY